MDGPTDPGRLPLPAPCPFRETWHWRDSPLTLTRLPIRTFLAIDRWRPVSSTPVERPCVFGQHNLATLLNGQSRRIRIRAGQRNTVSHLLCFRHSGLARRKIAKTAEDRSIRMRCNWQRCRRVDNAGSWVSVPLRHSSGVAPLEQQTFEFCHAASARFELLPHLPSRQTVRRIAGHAIRGAAPCILMWPSSTWTA